MAVKTKAKAEVTTTGTEVLQRLDRLMEEMAALR